MPALLHCVVLRWCDVDCGMVAEGGGPIAAFVQRGRAGVPEACMGGPDRYVSPLCDGHFPSLTSAQALRAIVCLPNVARA